MGVIMEEVQFIPTRMMLGREVMMSLDLMIGSN